ncbi:Na(+)/H(+) antiporter subunit B [Aliidiomarina indica]|uniref:Na(+)/H(+) antiporter subunit B n=1 Tax=Aliidiomarina indica TaxID=2749147 RepID=UPI00188DF16D|nr:hydrogenase subunit MbhD domain-containing protein [Aliidiomarina indica]
MIVFDILLGIGLILAASGVFLSAQLFRSVVLFVVFGLLLAITWTRLQAPDLALAEAAIGAGLTGVLFLDTLGTLRKAKHKRHRKKETHS